MRDQRVENRLRRMNIAFDYIEALPLTEFDERASLRNGGRIGDPIRDDVVEQYSQAMMEGDEFPALISYRRLKRDVLVGGNHRLAAAKRAEREAFDTYRLRETDVYLIELLTRSINGIEGLRPTTEDMIAHARVMHEKYHTSIRDLAREFGLTEERLGNAIRRDQTKLRLAQLDVPVNRLADSHLTRLHTLLANEPVVKQAAELIIKTKMPTEQASQFVKEVREARSEAKKTEVVEAWDARTDMKERAKFTRDGKLEMPVLKAKKTRLLRLCHNILDVLGDRPTLEQLGLTTQDDIQNLRVLVGDMNKRFGKLLGTSKLAPTIAALGGTQSSTSSVATL